jgi:hypothetical protein
LRQKKETEGKKRGVRSEKREGGSGRKLRVGPVGVVGEQEKEKRGMVEIGSVVLICFLAANKTRKAGVTAGLLLFPSFRFIFNSYWNHA